MHTHTPGSVAVGKSGHGKIEVFNKTIYEWIPFSLFRRFYLQDHIFLTTKLSECIFRTIKLNKTELFMSCF